MTSDIFPHTGAKMSSIAEYAAISNPTSTTLPPMPFAKYGMTGTVMPNPSVNMNIDRNNTVTLLCFDLHFDISRMLTLFNDLL